MDGNSLIGVTQEQAAELISKTGPQVTLEVARNAASYYGLATLLNQPSPQVARHPRVMSHSQSYANHQQPQRQTSSQSMTSQPQHYLSQPYLQPGMQPQPSYANAPSLTSGPHLLQQQQQQQQQVQAQLGASLTPGGLLQQSQSSVVQEERHYQNISMYRQPQPPLPNPPNGLQAPNGSVRALNNPYTHPPHHNSYSSLHATSSHPASQPQMHSATLPGRPMSTVFPNNLMSRVSSMGQYPTYGHPASGQMQAQGHPQQPMYRSGHTGSVPALHPNHGQQWTRDGVPYPMYPQANGNIAGMSHVNHSQQQQHQLYGRSVVPGVGGGMMGQAPSRVSIVSTKGLVDGEQPPTGYRYVPSAYPTKSMDSLNNNNMLINGHNNNNNSMSQSLYRRNKNNSGNNSQEFTTQIEEQEERLRLLKLEEMKRHHELEVAQIQITEDRLLKEAKTRRGLQVSARQSLLLLESLFHPRCDLMRCPIPSFTHKARFPRLVSWVYPESTYTPLFTSHFPPFSR